ncbi:MAG TPA: flagellar protein FlbD [Butyrivibrio sp.]|nr:flagellar protein FlbD [Butyrivibrio sp.]
MIELTKLNDIKFSVNPELIEIVETTPDTVITLTTGRKLIVKESRQDIKNLVLSYKRKIYSELLRID